MAAAGQADFRAAQAWSWFWKSRVPSFGAMRTLPPEARNHLEGAYTFSTVSVHRKRDADGGQTAKYLLALADRRTIETVVMRYPQKARTTICVSSQVGCPIGCTFCATGQSGFDRNLSQAEIVDQLLAVERDLHAHERLLTNVVFMGMGEPTNNYAAVVGAIRRWSRPDTLNFSPRRVTISTIGLVPFIERLSRERLPVNLAISLHAPDDELRSRMIPVNRKYPVQAVVGAARAYAAGSGRRVSYEYVLLEGVNDSLEQASRLATLVRHPRSHVNLIPMNPIEGSSMRPPSRARVHGFREALRRAGVNATIRATRGLDIDAACGQLRAREARLASSPA
jgi:23S rRNA (adenine2503-C2)-methyltransferase